MGAKSSTISGAPNEAGRVGNKRTKCINIDHDRPGGIRLARNSPSEGERLDTTALAENFDIVSAPRHQLAWTGFLGWGAPPVGIHGLAETPVSGNLIATNGGRLLAARAHPGEPLFVAGLLIGA